MVEIGQDAPSLKQIVKERRNAHSDQEMIGAMQERELDLDDPHFWAYKNSPLSFFHENFKGVIGEGFNDIKDYIESMLGSKKGKAIGIELGGIGSQLFSDFTPGFFERSAAITLTDFRNRIDPKLIDDDRARNHNVIPGDLVTPETKTKVEEFLAGQKADLIITRMGGGLDSLPKEPYILGDQADYWYRQLSEGGLIFAEIPHDFYHSEIFSQWRELVKDKYDGVLDVKFDDSLHVLRMQKLPGAPKRLPLVPIVQGPNTKVA